MTNARETSPTVNRIVSRNFESIDITYNDEPARKGFIQPGTQLEDYAAQSPKVVLATDGELLLDGETIKVGQHFNLPAQQSIRLETGHEGFRYISRKVAPEAAQDGESRLARLAASGIGDATWWRLPREEQFTRLEAIIGYTPLERIQLDTGLSVMTKMEHQNPSGSHYDRAYFATIKHFEEIGFIQPGDELRDITSGSAGISLALISQLLGYKSRIIVPAELPANRLYPMLQFGAQLVSSGEGYVPHASIVQTNEILGFREDPEWQETRPADRSGRALTFEKDDVRICYLNHSENELSPASFAPIASEILDDTPDISHIVLAEGNWTTISGIAKRLRMLKPSVHITGYSGEFTDGKTENYGTNVPDVPLRFKDLELLDADVIVSSKDRDAMQCHAPHLGRSSLMGLAVAESILRDNPNANVVTLGYDTAERY